MNKVYFYVPNLIGYVRIVTGVLAFVFCRVPLAFFGFYFTSAILDALDGTAARLLNQASVFGAALDMTIDRCSTTALLVLLTHLHPEYMLGFAAVVALDIASHYAHLLATSTKGNDSHKEVDENTNVLLRYYYGNRYVLFVLCAGNEAVFLLPVLFHAKATFLPHSVVSYFFWVAVPFAVIKQFMNLVQLVLAFKTLADVQHTSPRSPVSLFKRRGTHPDLSVNLHFDGSKPVEKARQEEVSAMVDKAEDLGLDSPAKRTRAAFRASSPSKKHK